MHTVRAVAASRNAIKACSSASSQSVGHSSEAKGEVPPKPIEAAIRKKLDEYFQPSHLQVINESYMHKVPKGSETHFKVVIVSEKFANEPLIKRHRLVNSILEDELQTGVHALSITAKTPEQWENSDKVVDKSPPCRGGTGL